MNLKDWLKGLLTSADQTYNVAQRLIQSWYSTTPLPAAKRPHLIWTRDAETENVCLTQAPARAPDENPEVQHKRPVPLWSGAWLDRSRYPGVLLRTIRNWWNHNTAGGGYELGWARQLAIGAA